MRKAVVVVLLAILAFLLGQFSYNDAKVSLADSGAAILEATPSPTPTPGVVVIEIDKTFEPTTQLTPPPNFDDLTQAQKNKTPQGRFVIKTYDMPRDLEVLWNKILWFSPLRSASGRDPNREKIALLWVIINEYESGFVFDKNGVYTVYSALSTEDQTNNNFTWLFPKDFEELMMRPGDHDWFINSIKTKQPWHESATNDKIVHLVYNVWMSEKDGMDSGRLVPRQYIYYTFTKDATGSRRKLVIFENKEDLVNFENPYNWYLVGKLDKD